jgi:hypothetical protein
MRNSENVVIDKLHRTSMEWNTDIPNRTLCLMKLLTDPRNFDKELNNNSEFLLQVLYKAWQNEDYKRQHNLPADKEMSKDSLFSNMPDDECRNKYRNMDLSDILIKEINDAIIQISQNCNAEKMDRICSPSFLDISYKVDERKYYEKYSHCVDLISLLILRAKYYYDIKKDNRSALNDLHLTDILLSKLINVSIKYRNDNIISSLIFHYDDAKIDKYFMEDYLHYLRVTNYYMLGLIYYKNNSYEKAYDLFCSIIKMVSKDDKSPISIERRSVNKLEYKISNERFNRWTLSLYRYALLNKAKLVLEYGRLAESTKWLLIALSKSMTYIREKHITKIDNGRKNRHSEIIIKQINSFDQQLKEYIMYIDSILTDDVIDKEQIIIMINRIISTEILKILCEDDIRITVQNYRNDILIRIMYIIFLLRPHPNTENEKMESEWAKGQITKQIFIKIFYACNKIFGKRRDAEAIALKILLSRNIKHYIAWFKITGLYNEKGDDDISNLNEWIVSNIAITKDFMRKNERKYNDIEELSADVEIMNALDSENRRKNNEKLFEFAKDILLSNMLNKSSMSQKSNRIKQYLTRKGKIEYIAEMNKKDSSEQFAPIFSVLRRYNSTSPIIPRPEQHKIRGGGYFLISSKMKGIVIDPGESFLQNFYEDGFSIADIHAIIITHAHVDHSKEMESILTLIYEYNYYMKEKKKENKLSLIFNVGSMGKMLPWALTQNNTVKAIHTICPPSAEHKRNNSKIFDFKKELGIEIEAVPAKHNEIISSKYPVGLVIYTYDKEEKNVLAKIGITSDTGYYQGIVDYYKDCNPIILHLGDTYEHELIYHTLKNNKKIDNKRATEKIKEAIKEINKEKEEDTHYHQNHLAVAGIYEFVSKLTKLGGSRDIIISEYPEEMGAYRLDVARAIQKILLSDISTNKGKEINVISSDIGLTFTFSAKVPRYRCDICNMDNNIKREDIYHLAKNLKIRCIQNENERIDYRCVRHAVKPKRLWIQSSKYIHRKIFITDSENEKEGQ